VCLFGWVLWRGLTVADASLFSFFCSGNYKAYKAACAALDDSLVLSRHAVRAVAPKDAPTVRFALAVCFQSCS
jgi:hypothetical protein